MRTGVKLFLGAILLLSNNVAIKAQVAYYRTEPQTNEKSEFEKPPKEGETIIGVITARVDGGYFNYNIWRDMSTTYTTNQLIEILQNKADEKYKQNHPSYALRNFASKWDFTTRDDIRYYWYDISATVVVPDVAILANTNLAKAMEKVLRNVRQDSRIAIDQIIVGNGIDKEEYQDLIIDLLLEMGYRVVAKEYLEKLYKEQQEQRSGVFNEQTTVKENNFSAVGFYINAKVSDTSLRVQVINVSTGEYEGNVTIKY